MSQRGGSVTSHFRFGDKVWSPLVSQGTADILMAFEALEGLRYVNWLKPGGLLVYNALRINPSPVSAGLATYPEDIDALISGRLAERTKCVNANELATQAGTVKAANVVMLGAISPALPFAAETWEAVIRKAVPPKTVDVNLEAFRLGVARRAAAHSPRRPARPRRSVAAQRSPDEPAARPDHAGISVADLEASIAWYGDMLGFDRRPRRRRARRHRPGGSGPQGRLHPRAILHTGRRPLPEERRHPATDLRTHGIKHVAYAVRDIRALMEHLKAKGVDVVWDVVVHDGTLRVRPGQFRQPGGVRRAIGGCDFLPPERPASVAGVRWSPGSRSSSAPIPRIVVFSYQFSRGDGPPAGLRRWSPGAG